MKVLVIGSGGREHTLVWKIRQSNLVDEVYCAPGNAGISQIATCIDIAADNIEGLLEFALKNKIDLTVVGPEVPLTLGIVNIFKEHNLKIFGPTKEAAEIEGSKAFAKNLMKKYQIPTAEYGVFVDVVEAKDFVEKIGIPCVVKADGLAAGKGVLICENKEEAFHAIEDILVENKFGNAGSRVVIEEFLVGQEVSMLAFTDGYHVVPMVSAQDHKRIWDDDKGLNTGGMGAYSPAPIYTDEIHQSVMAEVLQKTVDAMRLEGRTFTGVLYAGLMLCESGPKVLEFNARFGDPETQAVLPRLESDLVEIILAILDERLDQIVINWRKEAAVCVVLAAGGYPEKVEKGKEISGLASASQKALVFHAGTTIVNDKWITSGGRVLGVTALGTEISDAISKAYSAVHEIYFDNMQFRHDIGRKALES